MVNPFNGVGSKTMQSRGRLGAYKQDLLAHKDGTGFRQEADTVDMNPILVNFPGATVQDVLEQIETFLSNGGDFISVGNNATSFGTYNVGTILTPTIEDCIDAAQNTLRLSGRGGIILIKAGTYNFVSTVVLNSGISIIGEVGGTILNAQTANPIFRVRFGDRETLRVAPAVYADTSKITRFYNLTFTDAFGDINPYLNLSSLIICNRGTSVSIENCSVFGKIGAAGAPPPVTRLFVNYDSGTTSIYNTVLNIENCYVAGVQQLVDFDIETARENKLTIKNNRVWVSGRLGMAALNRYTSAVAFRSCDANFSHNQIKFGLNLASLQTINKAFSCYDPGTDLKNLVVIGNQLMFYDESAAANNNRLLGEDSLGLDNTRSVISGNMTGASSDGNWYITVGDGVNSIGDINGEFAIQNIVSWFVKMPVAAATHGSVVIYVKHGSYTIDDETIFQTPASASSTGLPLALIGISENGNLPTITFDVAAPLAGGQPMMFGHRVENIHFNGGSNYYKVMLRNDFANPDARTVFFRDIHVRNCAFYNCSIGTVNAAAVATIEYMKNNTFIEDCQFANSAIMNNNAGSENTVIAINPGFKNGKIYINRCYTVSGQYRGLFLSLDVTNVDTKKITEVYLNDCIYTTADCVGFPIYLNGIKSTKIIGCKFDTSTAVTQPTIISLFAANTDDTKENKLEVCDCYYKGAGAVPPVALYFTGFDKVNIDKNTFENILTANIGVLYYAGITAEIDTLNVNLSNNRCIVGANSYGFAYIDRTNTPTTNVVNGNISIKNNSIDMQAKIASISYPYPDSDVYAPIFVYVEAGDKIAVDVSENNITKHIMNEGIAPEIEASIAVLNASYSKVCKNNITFNNTSAIRQAYGIYVSPGGPSAGYVANGQHTDILENRIISEGSIVGGLSELAYIRVRNTDNLIIKNNVLTNSAGALTWFIRADSLSGVAGNDGVISDNILSETLSNGGIKYKYSGGHNNIKLYVDRNKNQKIIHQIDCTDFKRYGYNKLTTQPYSDAVLLWKTNVLPITYGNPGNLNRSQLHILNDGVAGGSTVASLGSWNQLPIGLYYTNAYLEGTLSPGWPVLSTNQIKHQVIIPLRLPNHIQITQIDIPVYWKNSSGIGKTCLVSASLICGNDTDNITKIEYIPDTGNWDFAASVIANGAEGTINLQTTGLSVYVDQTRNTAGGTASSLVTVNSYIVLALDIFGELVSNSGVYFAIPHAKVTYTF